MSELDLREWLETDGLGGFASGTVSGVRTRRYHALLLAATHAADGPHGAGERARGLGRDTDRCGRALVAALRARRRAPGRREPDRLVRARALADLALRAAGRDRDRAGDPGAPRRAARAGRLAARRARRRRSPVRAPAPLGPRLPRAAPREPRLRLRAARARRRAAALRAVPRRARGRARQRTATTSTRPSGTAASSTPRSSRAGSTRSRTSPRPACCASICSREPRGARCSDASGTLDGDAGALARADALRADERKRRAELATPAPPRRRRLSREARRRAGRSSPAIRGSPTGAATRSSRCAGCASRPAGSTTRARSCASGPARCRRACCPTASPTPARRPSSTRWTRRSGTWSPSASTCSGGARASARASASSCAAPSTRSSTATPRGTRFGIRADADGLLAAGVPGQQLTWMDARIGDWVVTPRIGKPVEVQALWLNALAVAASWRARAARARSSSAARRSRARFWNEEPARSTTSSTSNHEPGTVDPSFRPNQILAVGGLPLRARRGRARATRRRRGRGAALDAARVCARSRPARPATRRTTAAARASATPRITRARCGRGSRGRSSRRGCACAAAPPRRSARRASASCAPLEAALDVAGLGHCAEVADAEPPHRAGGCPFQAWSLGELIRLREEVLS